MRPHALILLTLVGASSTVGCAPPTTEAAPIGRLAQPIIDGEPASSDELFATVAIVDPDGLPFCTGTLIAPQVVVTAAHCLFGEDGGDLGPSDMLVVAGALVAEEADDSELYGVQSVVGHEGYDNEADPPDLGRYDDIAVLVLDDGVSGQSPAPILPFADLDALVGEDDPIIITGYGARDEDAEDPDLAGTLYIAETPFVERSDHEFTAGATGEPDSCPGDSGGPGYVDVDGDLYLIGAASRSGVAGAAACGDGGINTLVPAYESWLVDNSDGFFEPGGVGSSAAGSGSGGGTTSDDGGCAVRAAGSGQDLGVGWVLVGAAWLAVRRRRSGAVARR